MGWGNGDVDVDQVENWQMEEVEEKDQGVMTWLRLSSHSPMLSQVLGNLSTTQ